MEFKPYPVIPQQPREKPMRVLALGLSRTSTMSLYVALTKLGFKSYHMVEAALNSANDSLVYWDEAIQAKYYGKGTPYQGKDFEKMLWRYDAVTDIPCVLFVDELVAAYPEAKVILTTRDVEPWVDSIKRTFYPILSWKRLKLLQIIDTQHIRHYIPILRNALQIWTGFDWRNPEKLRDGYVRHCEHVRKVVPKNNLLQFRPQQGWEPLCAFLGVPVPNEPYPRVNEGDFAVNIHYGVFWGRLIHVTSRWAKLALPLTVAAAALWWFQKSQ